MKYNFLTDFKITKNSIAKIDELKKDNKSVFIRVMVTTGGCAGHQYHILMDDYIGETDYVLTQQGGDCDINKDGNEKSVIDGNDNFVTKKNDNSKNEKKKKRRVDADNKKKKTTSKNLKTTSIVQDLIYVVIDEASLEYLHNSTMDYTDSLEFTGFHIDNPNVTATCNCGNSFTCNGGFVTKKDGCKN